jgi:hypothetical protein
MIGMFASSAVDRGFEAWLGQIKGYAIGIWCFSTNHVAIMSKSNDWLGIRMLV